MKETDASGVRVHGQSPYHAAVVHGGPGAPGSAGKLATSLGAYVGTLEPRQSADSVEGQVEELATQLSVHGTDFALIGHSWGAMLSYLLAARHPSLVRYLLMVASAPFTAEAVEETRRRRMARLSPAEQQEFAELRNQLADPTAAARYHTLLVKADSVAPISWEFDYVIQPEISRAVSHDVKRWRDTGALLQHGPAISCPVRIVHGADDPHPLEGVVEPLRACVGDVEVLTLDQCGHVPWNEHHAQAPFLDLLIEACQ